VLRPRDGIPLSRLADRWVGQLALASGDPRLQAIDGHTLLVERARLQSLRIPGDISAGGGCRFFPCAQDNAVALNLSRPDDRALLPALFEREDFDPDDDASVAAAFAVAVAATMVERGRLLGLAIAAEHEHGRPLRSACTFGAKTRAGTRERPRPRVVDLSALWAGPLATHLLSLAGAEVIKVESRQRPDAMRHGDSALFDLLNQGKHSVTVDLKVADERAALLRLIGTSDIVIEAARPRALLQLGIDAEQLVQARPGLVWMTITAHGAEGDCANWVGFGDDCGVAAGLSLALRKHTGVRGFVGDAIADPLTGIRTAQEAWSLWNAGHGGRAIVSMRDTVAEALACEQAEDPRGFDEDLRRWCAARGQAFPGGALRSRKPAAPLGRDTARWLGSAAIPC